MNRNTYHSARSTLFSTMTMLNKHEKTKIHFEIKKSNPQFYLQHKNSTLILLVLEQYFILNSFSRIVYEHKISLSYPQSLASHLFLAPTSYLSSLSSSFFSFFSFFFWLSRILLNMDYQWTFLPRLCLNK